MTPRLRRGIQLMCLLTTGLIVAPVLPVGLPVEYLKIVGEQELSIGYVLDADTLSVKFVYYDGGIRTIPREAVQGRFTCPSNLDPSQPGEDSLNGIEMFRATSSPAYVAPECRLGSFRTS
jgi:hypothetical protein